MAACYFKNIIGTVDTGDGNRQRGGYRLQRQRVNCSKRSGICRKGDSDRCNCLGIGTGGCQPDKLIGICNHVVEIIWNQTDVES